MADNWIASKFFQGLTAENKVMYQKKLTLANGKLLPDPLGVEEWKENRCLPEVMWPEIYNYLINTPSEYTKESLKAYKSLTAYNFFICGHVQDVLFHDVGEDSEFCLLKSKVLPSQRQGDEKNAYEVWIVVHKKDSWILTGNCTCMAGLGSACSHLASVSFKVQAFCNLQLNKVASTSQLCAWNVSKRQAAPLPLKEIDFKRPKPDENTPRSSKDLPNVKHYSFDTPHSETITPSDIERLRHISNAAVLTSVDIQHQKEDVVIDSDTDEAEENDLNTIPEPITSLFDPNAINYSNEKLKKECTRSYTTFVNENNERVYNNLCQITKQQHLSDQWKLHRSGRLTSSLFHQICHTPTSNPSKSLLHRIMDYTPPGETAALKYGRGMEPKAREHFTNIAKVSHTNFTLETTGLHVSSTEPYLGASPDGIISCDCHGKGLLEIKCPYKYRCGLEGWAADKKFPILPDGNFNCKHPYYSQIQGQMMILDVNYCSFFIYTPAGKTTDVISITVKRDHHFINTMRKQLKDYFYVVLLPELLSRKNDPNMENPEERYCVCYRPAFNPMIACKTMDAQ